MDLIVVDAVVLGVNFTVSAIVLESITGCPAILFPLLFFEFLGFLGV